jgi:phosphohistidine swiveling domain-containing protein
VLCWRSDIAYVNWTLWIEMISAGWIEVVPHASNFAYRSRVRMGKLPSMLKSQWKIENFLQETIDVDSSKADLHKTASLPEQICESLKLGLAMQALMMRLPQHTPHQLAEWLAEPKNNRPLIERIKKIQLRRTALSSAWETLFPPRPEAAHVESLAWFWETEAGEVPALAQSAPMEAATAWQGLPVHPGRCRGVARLIDLRNPPSEPLNKLPFIAVFKQARPGTIEHFAGASAIVFIEGGVLSHACTIAREQGIPTVTAVGKSLLQALATEPDLWLTVDGSTGWVEKS